MENITAESFSGCKSLKEVSLGKGIRKIGASAFAGAEYIETIYSHNPIPPTCDDETVFDSYVYKAATLYVPNERNASARYKAEDVWNKFFDINETDLSNINTPLIDATTNDAPIYNLQGQRQTTLQRGLNIVGGKKQFVR